MAVVVDVAPPPVKAVPLSKPRLAAVLAAPLAFAALAWGSAVAVHGQLKPTATAPAPTPVEVDGAVVYARHCASCHGPNGDGDGVAQLDPRARAFGKEKFKFGTTVNGVPCDDDLARLVRRGIPGSAMPAFDHETLPEPELRAAIDHVRLLTRRGLYAELKRQAEDSVEGYFEPVKATKRVAEQTAVGQPIEIPAFDPPTPESIARGKALFLGKEAACSSCHGDQGRGDGPQGIARLAKLWEKEKKKEPLADDEKLLLRASMGGVLVFPRNLTSGVFKGGRDPAHIYARIKLGIPGALAMPAAEKLPPEDVRDLVNFVLSLSERAADGPRSGLAVAGAGQ